MGTLPYSTRLACGIDLGTSYVVTGGHDRKQRVTQYSLTGEVTELPDLINRRRDHACSSFQNTEGMTTLLVTGGDDGSNELSSTEIFILGTGAWMAAAPSLLLELVCQELQLEILFMSSEDAILLVTTTRTFSSTSRRPTHGYLQGR